MLQHVCIFHRSPSSLTVSDEDIADLLSYSDPLKVLNIPLVIVQLHDMYM